MNFKKLIDNPHPIYTQNVFLWNFLLQSYEGGLDYTNAKITFNAETTLDPAALELMAGGERLRSKTTESNLFSHSKERDEDFKKRLSMSYYYNLCAPIIDTYTNHIFKLPVIEDFANIEKAVEVRDKDIDLMGSSVDEFRVETADLAQIYGHIYTLVDSPKFNPNILTMKDKNDNKQFPFFMHFRPQDVLNWALDGLGKPHWVLLRESEDSNIDPFAFEENKKRKLMYRLWTRQEWILIDEDGNEIDRATHGLGFVPLSVTFDKRSKKARNFLGVSFITDLSLIARDIYNSASELRQILRDQTFSFLVLQGDANDFNAIEVATNKGLRYPKETNQPQFISPDAANAEVYFKHIDRQVDKMFELAMLPSGSASFEGQSAVQQSGVSKAWDFNQTNSALSKKASNYEDGELKAWEMFAKWEGKEWDGSVEYPREFNVQSLIEDLNEAKETLKLGLGATFDKEIKQAIVKKKFPQKTDQEIDAMVKEFADTNETGTTLKDKVGSIFRKGAGLGAKKEEE